MASDDDSRGRQIKRLREESGFSRERLAVTGRISIDSVRRAENDRPVRLSEAMGLAQALGHPPEQLFPAAFDTLRGRGIEAPQELNDLAWNDPDLRKQLAEAGIDIHPAEWELKVHFRGGEERGWALCSSDVDRFWIHLDRLDKDDPGFFVFSSTDGVSVAINLCEVAHAHVLFDAPGGAVERVNGIAILLAGEREWLPFGAEYDEPDGDEPGAYQGQLNEFLADLEGAPFGQRFAAFQDEDGERAVFQVNAVAAVTVSQELLWGHDDELADDAP